MKAYILASGVGSRLRPLTDLLPKPMVPFLNRPLVSYLLDHVAPHVSETRLNVSYNRQPLIAYLQSRKRVSHFEEGPTPIGSAKTLYLERNYCGTDLTLVLCGDLLCNWNIASMVHFHQQNKALVSVAVRRVPNPQQFGVVVTDSGQRIVSFHEKPQVPPSSLISCGIYLFSPEVFYNWNPSWKDIGSDVLPALAASKQAIYAWPMDRAARWNDIGTIQSYLDAHLHFVGNKNAIATATQVPSTAHLHRTVVGAGAQIAPHAHLEECIVWPGATVHSQTRLRRAIVLPDQIVEVNPLQLSA
jgi:mannose-1-phosphate guanylyltransferase